MVLKEEYFLPTESQTKFGEGFINQVRCVQPQATRIIAPALTFLGKIASKHLVSFSGGGGNGLVQGITPCFCLFHAGRSKLNIKSHGSFITGMLSQHLYCILS